jgi:hypothetical protein
VSAKLVIITMLLLLPALAGAQQVVPCPGDGRPLSEARLIELVKGKAVFETRKRQLVASCGIDFEPTDEAIARLRSEGASEVVLDAVRAATGPAERKRQAEQSAWESTKDSRDPRTFERFLRDYPNGRNAGAARQKLEGLRTAALPPPPPPPVDPSVAILARERQAILQTLAAFSRAVQSKDEGAIRSIWPSIPAAEMQKWRDKFRNARSIAFELHPKAPPAPAGDVARMECATTTREEFGDSQVYATEGTTRVTLRKQAGNWVIESMR